MKDIQEKIKSLRIKKNKLIKEHHKIISGIETEISKLKKDLQQVCPHIYYDIVDRDYFDIKFDTIYWKEKVCKECGKVLGTSKEVTIWTEFK